MVMTRRCAALALAAAAAAGVAGCGVAFRSSADEFERTQPLTAWGARPPADHLEVERAFVLRLLKDPESARFEHRGVARFLTPASQQDPSVVPVWRSLLLVNARNSFGGYTGAQAWSFLWHNGRLYRVQDGTGRLTTLFEAPPGPVR
jgi:hypothetical protein